MIALSGITLRRGSRVLLDNVSLAIPVGERVGLIGRNGAGKTSLFALIDGSLHEDGGDFFRPLDWQIAQVAQSLPAGESSATDFVLAGDAALAAAQNELRAAIASADGQRLADAHMHLHDAGAHDARPRAQSLLLGLGFGSDQLDRPVDSFSGGWRMRLQLARALLCRSDLLLLDEPTNHLDLDALVWLESWLRKYPGTLLVISHDKAFVDAVCTCIVHLDGGRLTRYSGNYAAFEEQRAQQLEQQQGAYLAQQQKIARLQSFVSRFKAKATKARQAQSRLKALERMERLAPVLTRSSLSFEFLEAGSMPNPMLVLENVSCGYPPPAGASAGTSPAAIVRQVNRSVMAGQRIGILGANGQGKTTLVKTIAGLLPCTGGALRQGRGLEIGYFAQHELDVLRTDETPLAHLARLARETAVAGRSDREQDLRSFLGSFGFAGDSSRQIVGTLSGGERARLVLAMIVWQRPNLLLLDEPTNHLDLETREALALALNEFEGALILVSHDRALLRSVCDEFWLVRNGGVEDFAGDLDEYQRYLLEEARQRREGGKVSPTAAKGRRDGAAAALRDTASRQRTLQRQQLQVEEAMSALQAEQQALEQRWSTALPAHEAVSAGKRLKEIDTALRALEDDWLALAEQLEATLS